MRSDSRHCPALICSQVRNETFISLFIFPLYGAVCCSHGASSFCAPSITLIVALKSGVKEEAEKHAAFCVFVQLEKHLSATHVFSAPLCEPRCIINLKWQKMMLINYTSRRGKNKPITRMKAERNVCVNSQLQTKGGERRERGRERGKKIMRA